ncbi:choline ABC transporter substrate-binding protein [Caballeronia sp. LZ016]|nr:choline ABC transporter substrate-binding protein [Caballeronia sp. LZ016]MDR5740619.1 choline ABC transporter substrate-binding protein [Caballeronia sp. LZ016]
MRKFTARMMCSIAIASSFGVSAHAADPAACRAIRMADIGWSDIAATTGLATNVLLGLDYAPSKIIASEPITFAGVKAKQIDAFLGYWSPSMDSVIEPFVKGGSLKVVNPPNLTGAKYTLAVPDYVYDAGIRSFADIARNADKLQYKIYGIEPGNEANGLIDKMIKTNQFGLGKFKLVESSEAGMLVQVNRAVQNKQWIVFLGWEPHPMNVRMKIKYLAGGDDVFGPNYGEAKVYTVQPSDYAARCPNAARLFANLRFTTSMENQIMTRIMDKEDRNKATLAWLKANPSVLDNWLSGVTTLDGKPGLPAVKAYLAEH